MTPQGSPGPHLLLWVTWREFETSCSPSANINKLAVPWVEKIAKILQILAEVSSFGGPPQLLSMEAGECIFLRSLRTAV